MLVGLLNLIPMSKVVHMQYPHDNIQGPCCALFSVVFSRVVTESGAVQTGQLKQFRAHL